MRTPFRVALGVTAMLAAFSSPLLAKDDAYVSINRLDDEWVERAKANPESDQGWDQSCDRDWSDGRVSHCDVRSFSYSHSSKIVAINGGDNGGMAVLGWDRDSVRILYRVTARARTEERARSLAAEIQLELTKGWLRPEGPPQGSRTEWWSVEIKAWVPRKSDLALQTHNGPASVHEVRGTMDLNSTNGPLSLVDLAGAVQARVENGPLYVALAGSHWDGAGLDAEALNGPLTFELPADYSARLETGTRYGPESFDYAIGSRRQHAWIKTTLGNGGPPVRVVTTNGPFQMGKR
jgi:hypothetical protein